MKRKVPALVLEARPRVGGRTLTVTSHEAPFDLGATWVWPHHRFISELVDELGLATFPQFERGQAIFETVNEVERFEHQSGNFPRRLERGTQAISLALAEMLTGRVQLRSKVASVRNEHDGVRVQLIDGRSCEGSAVVVALLPRVAERSVTFEPALPDALQSAQRATPTWMGGSAKAVVVFERPFWRDEGLPGFAMSYRGPLGELHDVSPDDARVGAIKGFFASSQSSGEPDQREEAVLAQLTRLYGSPPRGHLDYFDYMWWRDERSSAPADRAALARHPVYGHAAFQKSYWGNKLLFAGTETGVQQGGYLDGAVEAAQRVAEMIVPVRV